MRHHNKIILAERRKKFQWHKILLFVAVFFGDPLGGGGGGLKPPKPPKPPTPLGAPPEQTVISKDILRVEMFLDRSQGIHTRLWDGLWHPLFAHLPDCRPKEWTNCENWTEIYVNVMTETLPEILDSIINFHQVKFCAKLCTMKLQKCN